MSGPDKAAADTGDMAVTVVEEPQVDPVRERMLREDYRIVAEGTPGAVPVEEFGIWVLFTGTSKEAALRSLMSEHNLKVRQKMGS